MEVETLCGSLLDSPILKLTARHIGICQKQVKGMGDRRKKGAFRHLDEESTEWKWGMKQKEREYTIRGTRAETVSVLAAAQ
jgi:hypothetical protein